MRRCLFFGAAFLAVCVVRPLSAQSAVITGRVVDSSGRPVAGAEVRVWQKLPAAVGRGEVNQPVMFDDAPPITDDEGRFVSPDVLVAEAFTRVVAEADGMLAGRSGWFEVAKDGTVAVPDIVLKRLRTVTGEVDDRRGQPVAGVSVFNSGDGHQRVETKTGRTGKFLLEGVPEGPVFLFAEKPGYRFAGVRLAADHSQAGFSLTLLDEQTEPLVTLAPLVSLDEEKALARQALDPWLREVRSGAEMQKMFALASLSHLDPLAAIDAIDSLNLDAVRRRTASRNGFLDIAIAHGVSISAEKLQHLIGADDDPFVAAYHYILAARHLAKGDRQQRLAWLDAALFQARRIRDPAQRAQTLAVIADSLFSIGDRDRGTASLTEAERAAQSIPHLTAATFAISELALATVNQDRQRAFDWWEKVQSGPAYERRDGELVLRLLRQQPDLAERIWNFAVTQAGDARVPPPISSSQADICYRLAKVDFARAERMVAKIEEAALHIRCQGAIALALAESDAALARRRLELLVRDELSRLAPDEGGWGRSWSAAATAAWLLPIAERVAPDLCGEILWRSLALRLPRPRRDYLDDEVERDDLELVKMLARYDRDLARNLLDPTVKALDQLILPATTKLKLTSQAARNAAQWARDLIAAAVYVDPHFGRELLDRIVAAAAASKVYAVEGAKQSFVWSLTRPGPDRFYGFWNPDIHDGWEHSGQ